MCNMLLHGGFAVDVIVDKNGHICYKERLGLFGCDGYALPFETTKLENVEWKTYNNKNYFLVDEKMNFKDAKNFCLNICCTLFEPGSAQETKDSLGNDAYYQSLEDVHVGIEFIKGDDSQDVQYFYSSNPSETYSLGNLDLVTKYTMSNIGATGTGIYPFSLQTGKVLYNNLLPSDYYMKKAFACQHVKECTNPCYLYGYEYKMTKSVKHTGITSVIHCQKVCEEKNDCNYFTWNMESDDCHLGLNAHYKFKKQYSVSGPKSCYSENKPLTSGNNN